ncbi:MAG: pyridine nucleotide-disulfide oxidoreductase [Rhizobiales bacterium]|nr:pyridine nucleotide-disulfide oxidoreductase [Hyphomicrobiales bacterium]
MTRKVVIVGAGQAGYQVAASLRGKKFDGPIVILGEEPALPYQRPPLSKGYVKGEAKESTLLLRSADFYTTNNIEVRLDCCVAALDRTGREVVCAGGERMPYDSLVLATGGRVRKLPVPGAELAGVAYVRTLADAVALKPQIEAGGNVVVIGGGFIGLECASVVSVLGCKVVVLEAMDRLMARVVSPVLSDYYRDLHRGRGVDVRLGASVTEIVGTGGRVTGVRCGDGSTIPADLVVVGIGIIANDDLAKAAGLACDRGIVVDALLRTADPDIYAIGDCAAFPHPMAQGLVRLESVQNAIDQGKIVADAIMGEAKTYAAVPWFWSDQYEVKLQIVGLTQHYDDTVTLGDVGTGRFSVLYFRDGAMIGIDSVNMPSDHVVGRKLFGARKSVTIDAARAPGFSLRSQV